MIKYSKLILMLASAVAVQNVLGGPKLAEREPKERPESVEAEAPLASASPLFRSSGTEWSE